MKFDVNRQVLVPMDYSDFCAKSIEYALSMIPANQIEIIHVAQRPTAMSPGMVWDTITDKSIIKHCRKSFEDFREKYHLPEEINFVVRIGDPAEEISVYAKETMPEFVLVSSHGRKGIARFFLGSVAERVVRLAPCPVLVFKPEEIANDRKAKIAELSAMTQSMFDAEYT